MLQQYGCLLVLGGVWMFTVIVIIENMRAGNGK